MNNTLLKVENVTKKFAGLVALNKVNMEISKGQILGLIGPNGAGKTTLFNVITGFYEPEEGKVYFRDEEITGKPPHKIAKLGIGRTFQVVKPFLGLTVEEAVRVGAYNHALNEVEVEEIISETLNFLGLSKLRKRLCKDLNLVEMKLTTVAQALAAKPELLLLDELAAGLTPTEIDNLIALLRKVNEEKKITLCLVEHVMHFIMGISDYIVVLHYGEKIAEGKPEEVASNEKVIEAYLGRR